MHGYGLSHSAGDKRPIINKESETKNKAVPRYIQTSLENGDMKENSCGGSFLGFSKRIEIPNLGFES